MNKKIDIKSVNKTANNMRLNALELAFKVGKLGAHIGPSLSIIDILAVLYTSVLRFKIEDPFWNERDRFILSKGHGGLGLYTALKEVQIISEENLSTFEDDGGILSGQPQRNIKYGIEFASGSLGMGLSLGVGVALSAIKKSLNYNTFILLGNGECNEGSIWEAALSASQLKLGNLICIIDDNKMQSDGKSDEVLDMGNWEDKWNSFGFKSYKVNGHSPIELFDCFNRCINESLDTPKVIIADTIKGYGVSLFENNPTWHHGIVTKDIFETARDEIMKNNKD
jgi:transketolase